MKKLLITVCLLGLISCIPIANNNPIHTSTATDAIERNPTIVTLPRVTQTIHDIVQRDYDPAEWKLIYNNDMIWQSDISPTQQIWITLDSGGIAFFDGDKWTLFSGKDYGFPDKPNDMAIAPDGTVWLSGRQAISRYQNGRWDVFPIPRMSTTAFTRLAVDPSGVVWLATPLCYCENSIKRFDGTDWDEVQVSDKKFEASQLLFTPDGTLWASFGWPGGVGKYDGKTWQIFSGTELWPSGSSSGIRIATNNMGNIFGIYERQTWIVSINNSGDISRIPFDSSNLSLNPALLRLFVDKQGTIWINACLKNQNGACLAYYKDGQWTSFVNLPFSIVSDINDLSDETLLVASENGLYQLVK